MKKTTNVWQRGTACALGGFIGIFISRQFSNDWLWASVGLILGLFAGWMVAMFADNPREFMRAVKDAFADARQALPTVESVEVIPRLRVLVWGTVMCLAIFTTLMPTLILLSIATTEAHLNTESTTWNDIVTVIIILTWISLSLGLSLGMLFKGEDCDWGISKCKEIASAANALVVMLLLLYVICNGTTWTWQHRADIRRAINIFFANMVLYFIENAGLAILTNVALALGVGHYHGYVAGVAVGFISGVTGAVIYNKGQDSLRAIVAKSS